MPSMRFWREMAGAGFLANLMVAATASAATIPCRDWDVTIRLDSASAPPAALQFRVDYARSGGMFLGSGADVQCESGIDAFFGASHNEAERWVRTGTISVAGLPYPGPIATCRFREYSGDVPEAGDLDLLVENAADVQVAPIEVAAELLITAAGPLTECEDRCGDGFVDARYEECDDGNAIESDDCATDCRPSLCGNGVVDATYEQCDDGNEIETDDCLLSCVSAVCGDGVVRVNDEECDDGNLVEDDGCSSDCELPFCGDGVVEFPEECDDLNSDQQDGCLDSCHLAFCGDGVRHPVAESCDDGNMSNEDLCTTECRRATCGDGYVRAGTEECDDGNRIEDETCAADCGVLQSCGDAIADGRITASDAMRVLEAAIGRDVECAKWLCDVDSNGQILTSDALRLLRRAVGQPFALACGPPTHLVLRLSSLTTIKSLTVDVDYVDAAVEFVSPLVSRCEPLAGGVWLTLENVADRVLRVTAQSLTNFGNARSIARCPIIPGGPLSPRHFTTTVVLPAPSVGLAVRAVPY